MKALLGMAAAFLMAGCCTCTCEFDADDPLVGNWGLKFGYDNMSAGHMILSRDANGQAQALVLWRWASPEPAHDVVVKGDELSCVLRSGLKFTARVKGCRLSGTLYKKNGAIDTSVEGWRNPPIAGASTKDAKFGEPIDLLKDGLAGWEPMEKNAKNGWRFEDGVLTNVRKEGGANLISKRADFYDFNLDYDVCVPEGCNSGVYLRGRYEIQTVDSYGKPVNEHNMAAYYGRVVPKVAAEKAPGEWQHVNVTLYKRHLTVVLNGVTIIEDAPVVGVTGGAIDANEFVPGPLYIQGDHSDASYRNMILRPVVK